MTVLVDGDARSGRWVQGLIAFGLMSAVLLVAAVLAPTVRASALNLPPFEAIVVDEAAGHVFVSIPNADQVAVFGLDGTPETTIANLDGASGMTLDNGQLYVAETSADDIVRLDPSDLTQPPAVVATGLTNPYQLVSAGGRLWVTQVGNGEYAENVVSVDPVTGSTAPLALDVFGPDLAVAPGAPNLLWVIEDDLSTGTLYSFDVSGATPVQLAASQEGAYNQDLAVSSDGTRVIAAGGGNYQYSFPEVNGSTLTLDGIAYPGGPYPAAVATSPAGEIAVGLEGLTPQVIVYRLGNTQPIFDGQMEEFNNDSGEQGPYGHGLALNADGTRLYAISEEGSGPVLQVFDVSGASGTSPTKVSTPAPPAGATSTTTTVTTPTSTTTPPVITPTPPSVTSPVAPATPSVTPPVSALPPSFTAPTSVPTVPAPVHDVKVPAAESLVGNGLARLKRDHSSGPDATGSLSAQRDPVISARTHQLTGYRYYFYVAGLACRSKASRVDFRLGRVTHHVACRSGRHVVSPAVTPGRTYRLSVRAWGHTGGAPQTVTLRIPRSARWRA